MSAVLSSSSPGAASKLLTNAAAGNERIRVRSLDIADAARIAAFAVKVRGDFPKLNVVVDHVGIMRAEPELAQSRDLHDAER